MADGEGTILATVNEKAAAVGAIVTFAGQNTDARTGKQLIVPSRNLEVYMTRRERVINMASGNIEYLNVATGVVESATETTSWEFLYPSEYEMWEEVQPRDHTASVPYTFRYQPTRERYPFFPNVGIFEVWFKFVTEFPNQDNIRLPFLVNVGSALAPRRV